MPHPLPAAPSSAPAELPARRHPPRAVQPAPAQGGGPVGAAPELRRIRLDAIDPAFLPRDRRVLARSGPDWDALVASLAERGQQHPVDVVDLGPGRAKRYGLISGWRRWAALGTLFTETGDRRHATILAALRPADDPVALCRAMLEENQIRAGVGLYGLGRLAVLAADQGRFPSLAAAVDALFANADRSRRYRIRAFAEICDALDGWLSFPEAIGERLGLTIARALLQGRGVALRSALAARRAEATSPAAERALLRDLVAPPAPDAAPAGPDSAAAEADASNSQPVGLWVGEDGARVEARAAGDAVLLRVVGLEDVHADSLQALAEWFGAQMTAAAARAARTPLS